MSICILRFIHLFLTLNVPLLLPVMFELGLVDYNIIENIHLILKMNF